MRSVFLETVMWGLLSSCCQVADDGAADGGELRVPKADCGALGGGAETGEQDRGDAQGLNDVSASRE